MPTTRTTYSLRRSSTTVDDHLDQSGSIPQVDEGEVLAVLAAAGHPAAQRHLLTDMGGAEVAAVVGTHRRSAGSPGHARPREGGARGPSTARAGAVTA